ncbi:MAG: lysylphosphatidylglycerol synthase transmembrane domain-containing protein [Bacteroidota bacterium]
MKNYLINFLKFSLFLGVGLGIFYLVYTKQAAAYQEQCIIDNIPAADCNLVEKIISDFRSVQYFWIFMVLLAFTISNYSRAARWLMLMHPLGYRPRLINAFFTVIIGYFANLGLPRVGEVIRAGMIAQYEKMAPEKVMGTIVVSRMMDVLSLLVVIGLAFILEFDRLWNYLSGYLTKFMGNMGATLSFVLPFFFGSMLLGLGLIYYFRKTLMQWTLVQKIRAILLGFKEGLQTIGQLERPWLFLFHTVNIWVMYFLMTYLSFFAFAPTAALGPVAGLMVFVFGAFGIVIPSPGGLGPYHFLVVEALALYNIGGDDAFSFANILFFSVQIGCNVILGILSLVLLPIINRAYEPAHLTKPQVRVESPAS